jgi:hypothetical protein
MLYFRYKPKKSFCQVSNEVLKDQRLSEGARLLYAYLSSLKQGRPFSDKFICLDFGISQAMLTRRKKELKDVDLIHIKNTGIRSHSCFIGYPGCRASTVEELITLEDAKTNI